MEANAWKVYGNGDSTLQKLTRGWRRWGNRYPPQGKHLHKTVTETESVTRNIVKRRNLPKMLKWKGAETPTQPIRGTTMLVAGRTSVRRRKKTVRATKIDIQRAICKKKAN
jgi:hypothetical protein